jgi:hypothetical protein
MIAHSHFSTIHQNLNEGNQKLLEFNYGRQCYHGNVVNTLMNTWWENNCKD